MFHFRLLFIFTLPLSFIYFTTPNSNEPSKRNSIYMISNTKIGILTI